MSKLASSSSSLSKLAPATPSAAKRCALLLARLARLPESDRARQDSALATAVAAALQPRAVKSAEASAVASLLQTFAQLNVRVEETSGADIGILNWV